MTRNVLNWTENVKYYKFQSNANLEKWHINTSQKYAILNVLNPNLK